MTQAYPLHWPEGQPRTERRVSSAFKTGLHSALKNVQDSLRLFGQDTDKPVSGIVLSSNVSLGNDRPVDPGIAVWFTWDGAERCIAVDRYPKPEDNLQAIHHILEARRTEMRHGGLHIVRQTFRGFTALPAAEQWWQVLGVAVDATAEQIATAYRFAARKAHPDSGGSNAAMARLNAARDEGLRKCAA